MKHSSQQSHRGSRRPLAGLSGILTYVLIIAAFLIPVPYIIQKPGPVFNTLGAVGQGKDKPLLSISGMKTYPLNGQLDMLTVGVVGGPGGSSVTAAQAVASVVSGTDTVVPKEAYYPLTTTAEDVEQENSAQMASSQDVATAAALRELDVKYSSHIQIGQVTAGGAADGVLKAGDVITTLDGKKVPGTQAGATRVQERMKTGGEATLGISRDGKTRTVRVTPKATASGNLLGVTLTQKYKFPIKVSYNVKGVGGPSAGTIFALTIVDALTPGDLTGDVPIAGTGEIAADGTVSPIGGARQKVAAADAAGDKFFLSPAANCTEVVQAAKSTDLRPVRIDNLHDARQAVESIADGKTDGLPSCSAD